jgi:hypothetical protein
LLKPTLLAGCAIVAAGVLAGCSESRIKASPEGTAAPPTAERRGAVQPAKTPVGQRFASAALDDGQLGGVRGGMSTGSGMMMNFSFQEATYVNHNLTQSIVVPTMTILPGSSSGPAGSGFGGAATQVQVSTPSQLVQSVANSGMTSVVSSLGGGGVTNHISNTANNQLVQQVITANIGITGLGQAIQQGVASSVMSRVQAANAQFR